MESEIDKLREEIALPRAQRAKLDREFVRCSLVQGAAVVAFVADATAGAIKLFTG